jgi:outer membrane protein assembly factor BamB
VDARSGKNIWKYESNNFINGAAACQSGVAVFGGCDGYLHLVDIATGNLKKKIEVASYIAGSASLSGTSSFIGDYDGKFTCVDMNTQRIKWQWQDETTNLPFICSPSILKDKVITGNDNKYVYCLDKASGKLVWKFNTGSRVEASTVSSLNKVLVANMRGDLFILELSSGKKLWSYEIGTPVSATPAVLKDRFIVASGDGTIYCFGTKK